MKKIILAVSFVALVIAGCYNDKAGKLYPTPTTTTTTTTCDTTTVSYKTDIQPIVNSSCAISGGCHNADGNPTTGNLDFTVFSILQSQATTSLIVNDITGTPTKGHHAMPLNLPALQQCDINKFTRWVNEGAPNN